MAVNTGLIVRKGTSKVFDINITNADGTPYDLTDALISFSVSETADDGATPVILKTSATSSEINVLVPATDGLAQILLIPGDTSALDAKMYVYKISVDPPGSDLFLAVDWSTFDIQSGGVGYNPPVFTNTVKIDHNYGSPNNLTYKTAGGTAVSDAQVRIYYKTEFDAGRTDTPLAMTVTNLSGQWANPIYLTVGFTYTVQFYKKDLYGPDSTEIVL